MSKKTSSKLLMDESPLTVSPSLAAGIGINEAIVIQQIHYWLKIAEKTKDTQKFKRGRWWTYNSYEQWHEQFPWMSVTTIRRVVKSLKDLKLIATVKHGSQGKDQTLWYTINYEGVDELKAPESATEEALEEDDESDSPDVSNVDSSTEGSMCPERTDHVSTLDTSYATETSTESSVEEFANAHSSSEPSDSPSVSEALPTAVPMEKYVTDRNYEAMRSAGMRLNNESYPFHLGRATDMLAKDSPTEAEIDELPVAFVRLFSLKGNADACSALVEMRRQKARSKVIGGSRSSPPSWEPVNPHSPRPQTLSDDELEEKRREREELNRLMAEAREKDRAKPGREASR